MKIRLTLFCKIKLIISNNLGRLSFNPEPISLYILRLIGFYIITNEEIFSICLSKSPDLACLCVETLA